MCVLLAAVPASIALQLAHANPVAVFASSAVGIVPLAWLVGTATGELAKCVGPMRGALLNATFGNATELIITLLAVRAGELEVVRASIIGSVVGNILLVLGMAVFVGGLRYKEQQFSKDIAGTHTVMMVLAVIAVCTPSLFVYSLPERLRTAANPHVERMSFWIAGLLIALYLSSLLFTVRTHKDLYRGGEEEEWEPPVWSTRKAGAILAGATVMVALLSELLVTSIGPAVASSGFSKLFVGIILVPIIGNAAEHATAITMAWQDKMDVSLNIAISSSTQVALFVAPLIVFVSVPLGHPMPFVFNQFELIAVSFSVVIAAFIARDGKSNWLEGAELLTVYAILALAFYFIPK